MVTELKTYVLVHGAWHGAWCWRQVADLLRAEGHAVFTPTLTGLGERVHLVNREINLSTHATDVINVVRYEELDDIILVGHSYAGHVVAMVADRIKPKIRHVVLIDSKLPHDGQPFYSGPGSEERQKQAYATAIDGYRMAPMDIAWLGFDPTSALAKQVQAKLTPQPMGVMVEPVIYENGGYDSIPKTYIRCVKPGSAPNPADPIAVEIKDRPGWDWQTIECGHDAMILAPETLTDMLLAVD